MSFDLLQLRTKKGPIGPPAQLHEEKCAVMKPYKLVVRDHDLFRVVHESN